MAALNFSRAQSLYPTDHSVKVTEEQLKSNQSSSFRTHTNAKAERLHQVSEAIMLPGRFNAQLLARVIQPLPGANKHHAKSCPLLPLAIRVGCLALWLITLPLALASVLVAFPLRLIDHKYRPALSYINNSTSANGSANAKNITNLHMIQASPLKVRTHNVGFVTSSMSTVGDQRPPVERVRELVASINADGLAPDVIMFQETFHEDATRILCEGIKDKYPYIIHNVAPQISGFNSGAMVASKYPLTEVNFHRFGHMIGPETAAPRGIISIRIESAEGPVLLYGVHTQALLGKARAGARMKQLEQLKKLMESDLKRVPRCVQVVMGDFNTSRANAWGEDNLTPPGQTEECVQKAFKATFKDLFLVDHCEEDGHRQDGMAHYLAHDNAQLGMVNLLEATASWYHGPFADRGYFLDRQMRMDRKKHKCEAPLPMEGIELQPCSWGTPEWHKTRTANTARFDYILLLNSEHESKEKDDRPRLEGRVEIRRLGTKADQSASTDHLPVDGRLWRAGAYPSVV